MGGSANEREQSGGGMNRRALMKAAVSIGGAAAFQTAMSLGGMTGTAAAHERTQDDRENRQHAWAESLPTDERGLAAPPSHHVLLFMNYDDERGTVSASDRLEMESAFEQLEEAFEWSSEGLLFTVNYSPAYFDRYFEESLPSGVDLRPPQETIDAARSRVDPVDIVAEDYDLFIDLASDNGANVLAAERALFGEMDALNGVPIEDDLTNVVEARPQSFPDRRTGFVGAGLPADRIGEGLSASTGDNEGGGQAVDDEEETEDEEEQATDDGEGSEDEQAQATDDGEEAGDEQAQGTDDGEEAEDEQAQGTDDGEEAEDEQAQGTDDEDGYHGGYWGNYDEYWENNGRWGNHDGHWGTFDGDGGNHDGLGDGNDGAPSDDGQYAGAAVAEAIPEEAPLSMGFQSIHSDNVPDEDLVTIVHDQTLGGAFENPGQFAQGSIQHASKLRIDLSSWYADNDLETRTKLMMSPHHDTFPDDVGNTVSESGATADVPMRDRSADDDLARRTEADAEAGEVIGHAQKLARARFDLTRRDTDGEQNDELDTTILRRDFNTTDATDADEESALHFLALMRFNGYMHYVRQSMNGVNFDNATDIVNSNLSDIQHTDLANEEVAVERDGFLDFVTAQRRGNFIVPPITLRSLPTPQATEATVEADAGRVANGDRLRITIDDVDPGELEYLTARFGPIEAVNKAEGSSPIDLDFTDDGTVTFEFIVEGFEAGERTAKFRAKLESGVEVQGTTTIEVTG